VRSGVLGSYVASVEGNDIGDGDASRWTDAALRFVEMFSADIGDEGSFSACTIIFAASSAFAVLAVLDDPDCTMAKFSMPVILGLSEPETRRVSPSRHRALMRSISASVV
jgi:hypothetical protein